ncbi:FKBP-type peptidylprolyl cis-trans isomerase [Heterostelium album PN500]|uniref:peptidylprolyl isomerase n=1 Tax=Heterostelium pallidum (strain ATCC 26659 / Pp 5 / PN500) TaxID=670386 RepID=D3B9X0_HETP5|nr:FKBP-type peptidylprolyl cis-trans isomerase [Heterostelium album PN500]EFA81357.1 FKBP-type peptidylprolyl cis-trans isomerase [Heterostelium album PN500]|eukprot:XP_020433475.1 FKBP-type peptidylprolyl cis-trans isomerase [Heterostelium album PN500]
MNIKYVFLIVVALVCLSSFVESAASGKKNGKLQIGVKHRPAECTRKTTKGDVLKIHYTGSLLDNGEKFDSSVDRGTPFEFTLGEGQVIKGWDNGLLNMCIGEKRKLTIPPSLGYGAQGAGAKIPGNSYLVFDTELIDIVSNIYDDEQ